MKGVIAFTHTNSIYHQLLSNHRLLEDQRLLLLASKYAGKGMWVNEPRICSFGGLTEAQRTSMSPRAKNWMKWILEKAWLQRSLGPWKGQVRPWCPQWDAASLWFLRFENKWIELSLPLKLEEHKKDASSCPLMSWKRINNSPAATSLSVHSYLLPPWLSLKEKGEKTQMTNIRNERNQYRFYKP